LVTLYGLTQPALNLQPRYNIAPTATIDVLIPRNSDQLELWQMRWGLVPQWWRKSLKELPSTFNARAETITGRLMLRDAFRRAAASSRRRAIASSRRRAITSGSRRRPASSPITFPPATSGWREAPSADRGITATGRRHAGVQGSGAQSLLVSRIGKASAFNE
jgi:hypothetical protein